MIERHDQYAASAAEGAQIEADGAVPCPCCCGKPSGVVVVNGRAHIPICRACNGAGTVPHRDAEWFRVGDRHRIARVMRGESLAASAARLGVASWDLNEMEHGRADPKVLAP